MGEIYALYELYPVDTEVDLNAIIAKVPTIIPAGVKYNEPDTKIAPVAFGLEKVIVGFIIDDSDDSVGGNLEEALRNIEGIENVECAQSTVL
ncbi:MAG: translation elongation factor EF-1beta [Candidatus Methanomethylophilaceae archaeon]|nr:translation elongation factor EF-1beta [Thermoplasmata archaeon]MBQ2762890.1 translation elongation factor EF-1beta [Candidatus Methanomethylophilaceae archaeon]